MIRRCLLISLGWALLVAGQAEGAAWSQKIGGYYVKVSGIFYSAD